MTRAFIFDLDNTLFETRTIPASISTPLFDALRAANTGDDAVSADVLERVFEDSWSIPFPQVAARHGLPDRLLTLWTRLHQTIVITEPLFPFADVCPALPRFSGMRILLTAGYRKVQHSKIDALGIRSYFHLILVDGADDVPRRGKQSIIADLLIAYGWSPDQVLIIGDSPVSELAAGRNLSIPTVQIMRPGVVRSDIADRHVNSLDELL